MAAFIPLNGAVGFGRWWCGDCMGYQFARMTLIVPS